MSTLKRLLNQYLALTEVASDQQKELDQQAAQIARVLAEGNDRERDLLEALGKVGRLGRELADVQGQLGSATEALTQAGFELDDRRGWVCPLPQAPVAREVPVPVADWPAPPPAPVYPSTPEGKGWRNNQTAAVPRDMTQRIEVVLMNGRRDAGTAVHFNWGRDASIGVAWWRFASAAAADESPDEQETVKPWPARATHRLRHSGVMPDSFAELHEGTFYGLPSYELTPSSWDWDKRSTYIVGDDAWQVIEERPV